MTFETVPVILSAIYRSGSVCNNTPPGGSRLSMDEEFISQYTFEGKLQTTVQSGEISLLTQTRTMDSRR